MGRVGRSMPAFPVRITPVWTAFSHCYFRHKLTDTSGHLLLKQERDTSKKYISRLVARCLGGSQKGREQ